MATTPTPQTQAQVLNAARTIAKQRGFYTKIFTQGSNGLSQAALITSEMKTILSLAGVEVPEGVTIGLDTAQILLAGGAFVEDLSSDADTFACVGDGANAVAGVAALLGDLGLIDSQLADFAGLIANVALAISSGGANVLADVGAVLGTIKCACDVGRDLFGSADQAKAAALKGLSTAVHDIVDPQIALATQQAALYTSGNLDYFDFVANVAANSPVAFKSYFPTLACFFPSGVVTVTSVGTSTGWISNSTDTERASFVETLTTREQVQDLLIEKFLTTPLKEFTQFFAVEPIISIQAVTYLALLLQTNATGDVTMNFDFNILSACVALGLTPGLLGDDFVFKGFQRQEQVVTNWQATLPYPPITIPYDSSQSATSGITINGKPYLTAAEQAQASSESALVTLQLKLQALDAKGDIDALIAIPEGLALLNRWAKLQCDPAFDSSGNVNNMRLLSTGTPLPSNSPLLQAGNENALHDYLRTNYTIDFTDYWRILSTLKAMQASNILGGLTSTDTQYGSIDSIFAEFQKLYQFTMTKSLNRLARTRVAQSLGIPPSQLASRHDSQGNLIFYRKVS